MIPHYTRSYLKIPENIRTYLQLSKIHIIIIGWGRTGIIGSALHGKTSGEGRRIYRHSHYHFRATAQNRLAPDRLGVA